MPLIDSWIVPCLYLTAFSEFDFLASCSDDDKLLSRAILNQTAYTSLLTTKMKIMKKLIILTLAFVASITVFAQSKAGRIDNTKHPIVSACPVRSTVIINDIGKCPFCGMDLNLSKKEQIKTQVAKAYSCPLYANIIADKTRRKMNISPKEEMKMKIVGLNNSATSSEERESIARH